MKILKYFYILLFAFAVFSCEDDKINYRQSDDTVPVDIEREPGMNLVGRVTVDGNPRSGVVVSDGVNVVVTNERGEYQMQTIDRKYVSVSVPADCEIPVENNFCKFYKKINFENDAIIQINFDLKSTPVKTNFTFYANTDVQIGNTEIDLLDNLIDNTPWLASIAAIKGDIIGISLGDIVWDKPLLYPTYKERMAKFGVPMLSVIGNHDHLKTGIGDITTDQDYQDEMGPTYYSLNYGDWHIVALDDILYNTTDDYAGTITEQQLAWLKEDLKYVDKSKSIIIGTHIPTSRRNSTGHVTNNTDLYELVSGFHQVLILSGHLHNFQQTTIASNIREVQVGAVMGACWGEYCNDGTPIGYVTFNMEGNEIVNSKYCGIHNADESQMRIYLPEEASLRFGRVEGTISSPDEAVPLVKDDETLAFNIYFWHTDWVVEVQVDGGDWTAVTPTRKIYDPLSIKYFQYVNSWERNKANPESNIDHLFVYKPENKNWKTFTVRATDNYGNIYTASVNNNN
jgi:hypothetical protein